MRFENYEVGDFFDEMFGEQGAPRALARALVRNIESLPEGELLNRQQAAERALLHMGITFNVYGERAGVEKIFPFDLVPRIVSAAEWSRIERGLKQRITALNCFIDDLYHEQKVIKDGVVFCFSGEHQRCDTEVIRVCSSRARSKQLLNSHLRATHHRVLQWSASKLVGILRSSSLDKNVQCLLVTMTNRPN